MFVYNITFNVEPPIESEWLKWMKNEHILDILGTQHFTEYRILRLINEHPDASGTTYAVQFTATNIVHVQQYLSNQGTILQNELRAKFGEKVLSFTTLLEEI
ncbi:MAG: DUF4286 family protein [Cyclobacteriaceae bacterium]|nr:hypothetical protein [Flammeovirgaceae bacterium]MDG1106495.1 DUF4286 family protein [Cyclobacteriaceae bacterium]